MDVLHIHNIRICDILLASAHQVFTPLLFPSLCLKLSSKHPLFGYDLIKVYICICLLNMIFFFCKKNWVYMCTPCSLLGPSLAAMIG